MIRPRHLISGFSAVILVLIGSGIPLLAKPLRVGVTGTPPFVTQAESGFSGISVDVWRAVAEENKLNYELIPQESPDEGIAAVDRETIDLLIGPISITPRRLAMPDVNFTQPYFFAKAGVLVPISPPTLFSRIKVFFGTAVISSVFVLIGVLAVVGTLVWLAERHRNEDAFPKPALAGISSGMWFALVTLTTVGYGDKAPVTRLGRTITSVWMVMSLIAVSSLTASLASAFTLFLSGAADNPITSAKDLAQRRVAVIQGTSGIRLAESGNMDQVLARDLESAVRLVNEGDVDAMIFDRPAIRYYLKKNPELKVKLAPFTLAEETYGFAFKTGSKLNMPLDVSILKLQRNGTVETLTNQELD